MDNLIFLSASLSLLQNGICADHDPDRRGPACFSCRGPAGQRPNGAEYEPDSDMSRCTSCLVLFDAYLFLKRPCMKKKQPSRFNTRNIIFYAVDDALSYKKKPLTRQRSGKSCSGLLFLTTCASLILNNSCPCILSVWVLHHVNKQNHKKNYPEINTADKQFRSGSISYPGNRAADGPVFLFHSEYPFCLFNGASPACTARYPERIVLPVRGQREVFRQVGPVILKGQPFTQVPVPSPHGIPPRLR